MPWKINKTVSEVIVIYDELGSFITQEDAVNEAKKLAREFKLIVRIFANEDEQTQELMTIDYTSFFNSKEMVERTTSELKLAKAEKNVAILELEQRIQEHKKNKNSNERVALKEKIKSSKIRLKKAELKLRAAKKRYRLISSKK
ncbi:hypothetical protein [Mesoplasma corruscae]|uniref:Uncharacterized protein n=1 Tax=Mesoplasma corruscae TaxID=216874 RepID=A0A2S5RGM8_9MOLU|nr:hypothetical protein [Mesoplasma corruscae]PPE06448.1 hypothetical protein MCORR_v1c00760 [Mesoplasma corruscae]